jgi:hypothetical protein
VCDMHGGKSPQAQRSARRRLTAMVDPALDALMRCLDCGDMRVVRQAAVDILDRCGFGPQATLTLEPSFAKLQHELQDMTTDELAERAEHVAHKLRVATQLQLPEADEQGEGGIIEVEGAIPHGD